MPVIEIGRSTATQIGEDEVHTLRIKPVARCETCLQHAWDTEPGAPTTKRSLPQSEPEVFKRLSEESRQQLRWDTVMCETLGLNQGYSQVYVLLIMWEENDWIEDTDEEIKDLRMMLEAKYGYLVRILRLKTACTCKGRIKCVCTPQERLDRDVVGFLDEFTSDKSEDKLAILYHTGHGTFDTRSGHLELHGLQDEEGQPAPPKVIWNHTERKVLQAAKCDVLTIMDSCFAGGVTALVDGEYGRTYEYLGASDEKLTTPRPGRTSFTRALINALGRLLKERRGQSFTTLDLQRVVVEEQNRLLPSKKVKKGVLLSRSNENKRRLELRPSKEQDKYFTGDTVRAYLNLRIELQQYTLSNEELDDLAKLISGAVLRSKAKTRRIDHIGLQSREKRSLQKTAGHFKTWKNFLQPTGILPQATEMATLEARDNRP